jgi:hypothetical protein
MTIATMMQALFNKGYDENVIRQVSPLFNKVLALTPILINSVSIFGSHTELNEMVSNEHLSELVIAIIGLLNTVSEHSLFFDTFSSHKV